MSLTLTVEEPPMRAKDLHIPVMRDAVVGFFDFGRPAVVVDGTLGIGGHSEALLERYPDLTVIGLEWDGEAIVQARERLAGYGDRFVGVEDSYANILEQLPR